MPERAKFLRNSSKDIRTNMDANKLADVGRDREENLERTTPMLQNVEIKLMKERILREVAIMQNAEISDSAPP